MELQQLRYFQTVARLEHMTLAARELYVAQPSLSRAIASLEEEIGAPLFDRQGRNIRLNPLGRVFLQHVERAFSELEEGQREVADMAGTAKGLVRLAILYTVSARLVPNLLSVFKQEYPSIHFHLFQNVSQAMTNQLERGDIDLCITSPRPPRSDVEWTPLMTEEIFLIVPPGHCLAGRGSIQLHEISGENFISLKQDSGLREMTDRFCLQAGFKPQTAFEVDEITIVRGLVAAGLGVAFIPALALHNNAEPSTVPLHITDLRCQRTIGLAWMKEHYLTTAAHVFCDFTVAYFARLEQESQ